MIDIIIAIVLGIISAVCANHLNILEWEVSKSKADGTYNGDTDIQKSQNVRSMAILYISVLFIMIRLFGFMNTSIEWNVFNSVALALYIMLGTAIYAGLICYTHPDVNFNEDRVQHGLGLFGILSTITCRYNISN